MLEQFYNSKNNKKTLAKQNGYCWNWAQLPKCEVCDCKTNHKKNLQHHWGWTARPICMSWELKVGLRVNVIRISIKIKLLIEFWIFVCLLYKCCKLPCDFWGPKRITMQVHFREYFLWLVWFWSQRFLNFRHTYFYLWNVSM